MNQMRIGCAFLAAWAIQACQKGGETRLYPEAREGMFHTNFAAAQGQAINEGKLIPLDMWRPG